LGKFDIDNILSELGVKSGAKRPGRGGGQGAPAPRQLPTPGAGAAQAPPTERTFLQEIELDAEPDQAPSPPPASAGARAPAETLSPVYEPERRDQIERTGDVGQFLLSRNAISAQQLSAAQHILRQAPGRRLTEILIEQGADEVAVQSGAAEMAGVPFERIDVSLGVDGGFDGKLMQRLGADFCKERLVLPLRVEGGAGGGLARVILGATRPDDVFLVDEVRRILGVSAIKLVVVTPSDIRAAVDTVATPAAPQEDINALLADVEESDVEVEKEKKSDEVDLEKEASESPVIRYVNHIINSAAKEGASDIHIEPAEKRIKVRFRIDGVLFDSMTPPASMAAAIISRVKIMANLDISERRIPQDGRIRCTVQGRKLDLRVSTMPCTYGEKVVMRILDTKSINVQLEELGFDDTTLLLWKKAIDEPHGIVLVTGPTGSGKTTTLYASLKQLDKATLNISTVEDPVEYHLDGITQTQTHEKIGMNFGKALKALLRQDPDVIMLGEIRDEETAHTAVQAALTGHLVLSTLHTNDAPSSITRLVNIGLEPFLVGAAVRAVLAQRLVRRLCVHCKAQEPCSEERAEFYTMQGIDPAAVWTAKGCDKCRSRGYSGRVGIYELLVVDDQLRDIIARNPNVAEFRRLVMERGMTSLRQDGMVKAAAGLTSVEEVLRATESNS
jgi:type IV pilus assembly protein PilB